MADDDVTQWMIRLGEGDKEAAQQIWQRYFGRLMRLARKARRDDWARFDEENSRLRAGQQGSLHRAGPLKQAAPDTAELRR